MVLSLAEAIGACRAWNIELGATYPLHEKDQAVSVDDLLQRIETTIGARIDWPHPVGHAIKASRGKRRKPMDHDLLPFLVDREQQLGALDRKGSVLERHRLGEFGQAVDSQNDIEALTAFLKPERRPNP